MKDLAPRNFSESENFCFFSDDCEGGVRAKLDRRAENTDNLRNDENFLEKLLKKYTQLLMKDFQLKFDIHSNEIISLKEI